MKIYYWYRICKNITINMYQKQHIVYVLSPNLFTKLLTRFLLRSLSMKRLGSVSFMPNFRIYCKAPIKPGSVTQSRSSKRGILISVKRLYWGYNQAIYFVNTTPRNKVGVWTATCLKSAPASICFSSWKLVSFFQNVSHCLLTNKRRNRLVC